MTSTKGFQNAQSEMETEKWKMKSAKRDRAAHKKPQAMDIPAV
jgi:hypothetical protein